MAAILALCLCVSLAALPALADESAPKYVAFGESCTNGYGFNSYYTMEGGNIAYNNWGFMSQVPEIYPNLLRDNYGLDTSVLAFSAMRMDDLYAVLQTEQYINSYYPGGDAYIKRYIMDPVTGTGRLPEIYDSLFAGNGLTVSEFYNKKLAEADVITLALGVTNLGTSITQRVADLITGSDDVFTENINAQMKAAICKEPLLSYYITETKARLLPANIAAALATKITSSDTVESILNDIEDALLYGFAGCCLYFKQLYTYIRSVNPDAELIIVGIPNLMEGLKFNIAGVIDLDLGSRYQAKIDEVMQFMKCTTKCDNNCYYISVSGVGTFADELRSCHGDPGLLSDDYYCRFVQNLILNRVHNYPGVSPEVANVSLVDLTEHFKDIYANGETSPWYAEYGLFYEKFVETLEAYSKSVQSDELDVVSLIENRDLIVTALDENSDYFGEGDILTVIAENQDEPWAQALAYINARFLLAEGVTVHPNTAGHKQIYDAIVNTGACLGHHDWCSTPKWQWSEDGTQAELVFTCKNNCSHKLRLPADSIESYDSGKCTETFIATVTYNGTVYTSEPEVIQHPHDYFEMTGVCRKCGSTAPCIGLEAVSLTNGNHVLAVLGKSVGSYTFYETDNGWTIRDGDGKYLALSKGKLVGSDDPFCWTYFGGCFSAKGESNTLLGRLFSAISGKNATKTYYIGALNGKACATLVPTVVTIAKSHVGNHLYGLWLLDEDGTWTRSCIVCGREESSDSLADGVSQATKETVNSLIHSVMHMFSFLGK